VLQPKIMAKATPAMPRKGANLGARSSVSLGKSAMVEESIGGKRVAVVSWSRVEGGRCD